MIIKLFRGKLCLVPIRLKVEWEYIDFDWKRCVLMFDYTNKEERDDEDNAFLVKVLEPATATDKLLFVINENETKLFDTGHQYSWRLKIEGGAIPTWTDLQPLVITK